jgi:hypothetical protein
VWNCGWETDLQVADLLLGDAFAVGASVVRVDVARLGPFGAQCHIVLVLAVVVSVVHLPSKDAALVVALEPVLADAFFAAVLWLLVGIVTAVLDAVAPVFQVDAHVIVALETLRWTIFSA